MARVLFVQPSFQPPGGGNGVASWMLQALLHDHEVTTLTWRRLDLPPLDRFYGTSLSGRRIPNTVVTWPARAAMGLMPTSMSLLRGALLTSQARRMSSDFGLFVSANNEIDFHRPSITYIHYPCYRRPRPTTDIRWYHHPLFVLDAYYAVADRLADVSVERLRENLVLTNSDWTGGYYRSLHGGSTRTLYPPVPTRFPDVPWADRENGFVSIGRIAPEKEIDRIIDIVEGVRRVHPDAHLHLVGTPGEHSYYRRITRRIEGLPWVTVHEDVSQREVVKLISMHRYGLHGMVEEHFGMAPAEMVCGGAVVWVPDGGGQTEIVARDPRFLYRSVEDAVTKILGVMGDADRLASARTMLARRKEMFSADGFVNELRELTRGFLNSHP